MDALDIGIFLSLIGGLGPENRLFLWRSNHGQKNSRASQEGRRYVKKSQFFAEIEARCGAQHDLHGTRDANCARNPNVTYRGDEQDVTKAVNAKARNEPKGVTGQVELFEGQPAAE